MRTLIALAAVGLMALSVPAFAQEAGAPGAIGTGGGLTDSNPPVDSGRFYGYGPGYDYSYGGPVYETYGNFPPGVIEGRGAAEDYPWRPGAELLPNGR